MNPAARESDIEALVEEILRLSNLTPSLRKPVVSTELYMEMFLKEHFSQGAKKQLLGRRRDRRHKRQVGLLPGVKSAN